MHVEIMIIDETYIMHNGALTTYWNYMHSEQFCTYPNYFTIEGHTKEVTEEGIGGDKPLQTRGITTIHCWEKTVS